MPWNKERTKYTPAEGWDNDIEAAASAAKKAKDTKVSKELLHAQLEPVDFSPTPTRPSDFPHQEQAQAPLSNAQAFSQGLARYNAPIQPEYAPITTQIPTQQPYQRPQQPAYVPLPVYTRPQQPAYVPPSDVAELKPYDPAALDKPSLWGKAKSVLSSVFSNDGDIHNQIRAGANELASGAAGALGVNYLADKALHAPVGEMEANLHKQNVEDIPAGLADSLNLTGKLGASLVGGEVLAPAKLLNGLKFLNNAKTATGALKATLPQLENTIGQQLAKTAFNTGTAFGAGEALKGATQKDLQDRNIAQIFGAEAHRGVADFNVAAGQIAKWQGYENLGNDFLAAGKASQEGFDTKQGFKGWESFLDPKYLASSIGRNLPTTLAFLPLGLLGRAVGGAVATTRFSPFGREVMQAIGAGAFTGPVEAAMEAAQVYDEMRKDGHTIEEAKHASSIGFWGNTALLGVSNALEFGNLFMPKSVNKVLGSLPGKFASSGIMEGGEEGAQQWISNSVQGKPTSFSDPSMQEAVGGGFIMGGVFVGAGHAAAHAEPPTIAKSEQTIQNIKDRVIGALPEEDRNDLNDRIEEAVADGIPEADVLNQAVDLIAQTPEGAKLIEQATNAEVDSEHYAQQAKEPALTPEAEAALVEAPEKPAQPAEEQQSIIPDQQSAPPQAAAPTAPRPAPTPTDQIDFSKGARVTLRGMAPNPFTITGVRGDTVDVISDQGGTISVNKKSVHGNVVEAAPEATAAAPTRQDLQTNTEWKALEDGITKAIREEDYEKAKVLIAQQVELEKKLGLSPNERVKSDAEIKKNQMLDNLSTFFGEADNKPTAPEATAGATDIRSFMADESFTPTHMLNGQAIEVHPTINKDGLSAYKSPRSGHGSTVGGYVDPKKLTPYNATAAAPTPPDLLSYDEYQTKMDDMETAFIEKYGEDEYYKAVQEQPNNIPKNEWAQYEDLTNKRDQVEKNQNNAAITRVANGVDYTNKTEEWMATRQEVEKALGKIMHDAKFKNPNNPTQIDEIRERLYNILIQDTHAPEELWGEYGRAHHLAENPSNSPFGQSLAPLFKQIDEIIDGITGQKQPRQTLLESPVAKVGMAEPKDDESQKSKRYLSLWVGNDRETFDTKGDLRKRLHELSLEQLKTIALESKITGKTKLPDNVRAYADFITEAMTRDDFVAPRKEMDQEKSFEKMLSKMKETLTPVQYDAITKQLDDFMGMENNNRIDQILYEPTVGNVAVNYTDTADGSERNYYLEPEGWKSSELYNGEDEHGSVMKKNYPKTLAELKWNAERQPLFQGKPDYTGFAHKDVTKARHAEKLRDGIEEVKEANRAKVKAAKEQNIQDARDGIKDIDDQLADLEKEYQQAVSEQYDFLKKSRDEREGVSPGSLVRDAAGNVVDRVGRVSKNPEWYREFYKEHGHAPTNKELEVLAKQHIDNGFTDDGAKVPSWTEENNYDEKKNALLVVKDEISRSLAELNAGAKEIKPKKPIGEMTQNELSALANKLRVPAWGSKDKLIKRIELALKARSALEGKSAEDLQQESVAELEKIMLDADMLPTESGEPRNKANHIRRLLEWRDGKSKTPAKDESKPEIAMVDFADLLKTDVRINSYLTEEQMQVLEDAQNGKLHSVPYAIYSVHQESEKNRVLVQFMIQSPTPKGYTGVQRVIERNGKVNQVTADDADEIGMMKLVYENPLATEYMKARQPKETRADHVKEHQDKGGLEVSPGFTVKVGDYVNSSGFAKITGINKTKKTVMLEGSIPVATSELLPLETLVTKQEKQSIREYIENDMQSKYHLLRVAIDTTKVLNRFVVFNTDDGKMGTMRFAHDVTGKQRLELSTGPMKQAREAKGPDWKAGGRNDQGGTGFDDSAFITVWEIPSNFGRAKIESPVAKVGINETPAPNVLNDHHARMKERAELARQRIKAKYGGGGNTLSSGLPPDLLADLSIIGYTKILDGVVDLKSWSAAMMEEANTIIANSERIRKWLPSIHAMSQQIAESDDPDVMIDEILQDTFGETFDDGVAKPKDESTKDEGTTAPVLKQTRVQIIADELKVLIRQGTEVKSTDLFRIADKAYKGTQAEGRYTPKDAYDAMELAVNQYLLEQTDIDFTTRDIETVKENVDKLVALINKLPTQSKRTEEQELFQQFSTPPAIAYVAAWVADITRNDVVLEPSAGIGGLALFGKANGAEVIVNELDPRRLEIIKQMPFDQFFMEDGEQINNILPKTVKPTVVVMNPPFSTSATRGIVDTKNSFNHVEQALKRLEPNGRLVAILGQGREGNSKAFGEWLNKLKDQGYSVRSSVAMDGKNYMKYGTTFNVQILVIDKTAPGAQSNPTITKVNTLDEVIDLLGGIANDKQATAARDRGSEQTADQSTGAKSSTGNSGSGSSGRSKGSRNSSSQPNAVGDRGSEHTDTVHDNGSGSESTETLHGPAYDHGNDEGTNNDGRGNTDGSNDVSGNTAGDSGESTGSVDSEENRSGDSTDDGQLNKKEISDDAYEEYTPKKFKIKGAKRHPGELAESAAMAAIDLPDIKYKFKLPAKFIEDGRLSIAQLEVVAYAGQAHSQILRDGTTRKGFFVGDGTGLGKGREMVGIILDNFAQGRTKAVWVSENRGLLNDAKRDWVAFDGDPKDVFFVKDIGKQQPQKGVLFTTYTTMAYGGGDVTGKAKQTRLQQMVQWFGTDYDGVIVLDEAHNMQNAVDIKGPRGVKKSAAKARIGVQLQNLLPNARVVYASATGATEVYNLAFTERLGLWGVGTAFPNVADFISKITAGGIAAMELVARDMKSMGMYIARNLSYNGVKYDKITHNLTTEQTKMYDTLAESWQIVLQNINAALETIGVTDDGKVKNKDAKKNATTQFWGAQQRFFNQVLTALQMPTVIAEAKKDLADGKSVVMQLVNTNEASQKRELQKMEENEGDIEDLDLTPREIIQSYLDSSFPIQQFEDYIDDKGNVQSRPVTDSKGDPVLNAEAVAMKEELMNRLQNVAVPEGPLEMVLNAFGVDMVAEVTGRGKRVIYKYDPEIDGMRKQIDTRNAQSGIADADAFQNGPKRILMFSAAGGTGRSYHAERNAKNQQQRMHYLIQAGWEATKAVQGFGRTHRTNQSSAPVYKLFTTNLKGQMRFVSSIARRLDQLGALTKGQRETGSQGLFTAADNLESPLAKGALYTFYSRLARNQIPGLRVEVLHRMGLLEKLIDPQTRRLNEKAPELDQVPKFLNRILVLKSDEQNDVFNAFQDILNNMTEIARQDGTLDTGLENIKADKAKIVEEVEIRKDPETGSVTTYNKLELGHKTVKVPLNHLMDDDRFMGIYRNEKSKAVVAVLLRGTRTLENGSVVNNFLLQGAETHDYRWMKEPDFNRTKYVKLKPKKELKKELDDLVNALQDTGEWTKSEAYQKAVSELMPKQKDEFDDIVNALQAGGLTEIEASRKAVTELMMPMEDMWAQAMKDVPDFRTETLHMISGTLLPIWDRLPTESVRVVRARTDDGQTILGRVISENAIGSTLHRLGAERRAEALDVTQLADKILDDGYSIILVNGWKFSKRKVSGEWRIEITGDSLYRSHDELRQYGVFAEVISYNRRYFVPTDDGANQVLETIVNVRPIQEVIPPRNPNANAGLNANRAEDDGDASLAAAAPAGKPRKSRKKPAFIPVQRLIEETTKVLTPKAAQKIAGLIANTLETTVYKEFVKRGAQGVYSGRSGAAAVTEEAYSEWRVVGHELGHAFSDYFSAADRLSDSYPKAELRHLAESLYTNPAKLKNLSVRDQVEEGFAEFFRQWVADPETAEKNAPLTFDQFTHFIEDNPKLIKVMAKVRGMVDDDFTGTVLERVANGVISSDVGMAENLGQKDIFEVKAFGVTVPGSSTANRALFETTDYTKPAKKIMAELEARGIKVQYNLAQLLATTGNGPSKALVNFRSQATDTDGNFIKGRPIGVIAQEAVNVIGENTGWKATKLKTVEKDYLLYKQFRQLRAKDMFDAILLSLRLQERFEKGHEKSPITLEMAEEILEIAEARWPSVWNSKAPIGQRGLAEEMIDTFSYVAMEKQERSGLITAQTRANVEAGSQFYVPMIEDRRAARKLARKIASQGGGRTTKSTMHHYKGKVTPVLGAVDAMLIKYIEIEAAIEHKQAFDALHTALEQEGMGDYGRVGVPSPVKSHTVTPDEVFDHMNKAALKILEDNGNLNDVFKDRSLTFFTPAGLKGIDPEDPVIMNMRNGSPVYIQLHPDVYRMMMSMHPVALGHVAKFLAHFNRLTRYAMLGTGIYVLNSVQRDVGGALFQSKAPLRTLTINSAKAAMAIWGKGQHAEAIYNRFVSSGAFNSAAENMITNQLKHPNTDGLIRTTAPGWAHVGLKDGTKRLVRMINPVYRAHRVLKFTEEYLRVAEFISLMKSGMAEAVTEGTQTKDQFGNVVGPGYKPTSQDIAAFWDIYLTQGTEGMPPFLQKQMGRIILNAGHGGSEVTTNFQMHGASDDIRQYVPTVSFLHGTQQGLYRTAREVKNHPVKTGILMGGTMILSWLSWMLMNEWGDDEDKKFIQDKDSIARDKYWWFPSPVKGVYLTYAKPFEYAIPANMFERFLDHASGDPQARDMFSDMKSLFSGITGVSLLNGPIQSLIDMNNNHMRNGGDIVPFGEQTTFPYLQAGPDTSSTSQVVAKLLSGLGYSPRMTDYFIKQNFGRVGSTFLDAGDFALKFAETGNLSKAYQATKPVDGAEYMPIIGQVLHSPAEGGSRIVEDFYQQYNEVLSFSGTTKKLMDQVNAEYAKSGKLVWPTVPSVLLKSENITKLSYLPAMKYIATEMGSTRKEYAKAIAEAPDAEKRRTLTLQKDFVEKVTAGVLYGWMPAAPHPDAAITPAAIEELTTYLMAGTQKALTNERKTKEGVSDQVTYLTNMAEYGKMKKVSK